MKKNILSAFVFIAMISCVLVSCTQYEEPYDLLLLEEQSKQKATLNKETSSFKADVISAVNQTSTRVSGDDFSFSAEQIEKLRESSLRMFRSHGFSEEEVLKLVDNNELRLIFVATAFTALMEYPSTASYSMPKTRSESGETCYDIERIKNCLWETVKDTFGLYDLMESIEKKCIPKTAALKLLGKISGYVDAAIAIYDFSNCMGWV